jgi:hypothetical protein
VSADGAGQRIDVVISRDPVAAGYEHRINLGDQSGGEPVVADLDWYGKWPGTRMDRHYWSPFRF